MKNKAKTLPLILLMIYLLTGCGKSKEAENVDKMILSLSENPDYTMLQVNEAFEAYDNLTEDQQSQIENLDLLSSLESDMIDAVQIKIDNLIEIVAPSQAQVDELANAYSMLTDKQQERLENYNEAIQLRECEIVAIQAVNQFKTFLKDSSSFQLISAHVKLNPPSLTGSGVVLNYSATNSFGGRLENTACLAIDEDGEDNLLTLAKLLGKAEESMSTMYLYYLQAPEEEIEVDVDRVMNNLNTVN